MRSRLFTHAALFLLGVVQAPAAALAILPSYGSSGTVNTSVYSFTAASAGNLIAYFAGANAKYTNYLGLLVNGTDTGIVGLPNNSTAVGTVLDFGTVDPGDVLTFYIKVVDPAGAFYSDQSMNGDGINHVFALPYSGGDFGLPAGTFVGFEDWLGGGDADYNDLMFVFENVRVAAAPEPASWLLMIVGFGIAGSALRLTRRNRGMAGQALA